MAFLDQFVGVTRKALPVDRGLYVARPVANVNMLRTWAMQHGVPLVHDPHVTIIYSREFATLPLSDAAIMVGPDEFTKIAPLGPSGAVVLHLSNDKLRARYDEAIAAGAVSSYDTYRAHLTLYFDPDGSRSMDLSRIPLPDFPLILGPEAAGTLDENVFNLLFTDGDHPFVAKADAPTFAGLAYLLEQRTPHVIAALRGGMGPDRVQKIDAEQRLVSGWALVSSDAKGRPYLDRDGEIVPLAVMARATKAFMAGARKLGGLHVRDDADQIVQVGDVREALVVTPMVKKILALPDDMPLGVAITAKVASDVVWQMVKDRKLRMFSIGGRAIKRRGTVRDPVRPT